MAMIDYGAIAWKDGKLISTDMFTPMIDTVGWHDDDINGSYFVAIGDKELTLAFYKGIMKVFNKRHANSTYGDYTVHFGAEDFYKWQYWKDFQITNNGDVDIIVKPKRFHDYYVCRMKYNGHKYKVVFGYGVDLEYYKKWHIIDYYGTPWYKVGCWWRWRVEPTIRKIKNYFGIGEKK